MINKAVFFILIIVVLNSCNTTSSNQAVKSWDVYLEKARAKTDAIVALRDVYKELSILKLNQPTFSAILYDTCLTADLMHRIDAVGNTPLKINVLDLKYLDNFIGEQIVNDTVTDWGFLHSRDFDYFLPIDQFTEETNEKAIEALAHWYKIKDIRYTVVLAEQNKILPRTKYDNYVLGGYFQGYGILYDIVEHKVLCFFNFRVNNLSNKIEDYTKENREVYDAMIDELKSETKRKIQFELSKKLNIEETSIDPGL